MRKAFVIFAFPVIALVFSFDLSAQSRTVLQKRNTTVAARSNAVVSELDRQRSFLQKVTSRYEAVSISEFTPYFSYTYLWKALKENRDELLHQSRSLTPAQVAAVKKGYAMLEQDVLEGFVAQQLSVLTSELDLNEFQTEEVEKLLSKDLKQKRSLLSAPGLTQEAFTQRIVRMSEATEEQILAIFFPEQRERFRQEVTFNRDKLTG